MRHKVTDVVYVYAPSKNRTQPTFVHLACCYTYRVQVSECVTYSRKCSSWQQVLSYKYQYQRSKYQYKCQYLACKYKYKYQYPKIVLKYRSSTSTSTSTQYNKTGYGCHYSGRLTLYCRDVNKATEYKAKAKSKAKAKASVFKAKAKANVLLLLHSAY